ncbi:MAG: BTAD domain-containing putative transcriptional regulator [Actinomycetota bacterium]
MTAAATGHRFVPIATPPERVVRRDRLVATLATRFDHRLTTIVAPAGSGKTTAIAEAVAANRLAPRGDDIWVGIVPADRLPTHLAEGIAVACDAPARLDVESTIDAVVDSIWTRAPHQMAIVLDDVHELIDSDAERVVKLLLERLPANGSLVLVSRRPLDLGVGRLRAHGRVLELDVGDLEFTDDELLELHAARGGGVEIGELPRHAASADLRLVAGTSAGAEFVWEEILARIDPDRLGHLRRLAVLDPLDDGLIAGITDNAIDADELFAGLPLVDSTLDGHHRMHEILRVALIDRLEPGERLKTLSIAGEIERDRHRLDEAIELFHAAGDDISAVETARTLLHSPILTLTSHGAARTRRILDAIGLHPHLSAAFEAIGTLTGHSKRAADAILRAADLARDADDLSIESVLRHRAAQALLLLHDHAWSAEWRRIAEIGETLPLAAALDRYYRSVQAQIDGDGAAAVAHLDDIDALDLLGPKHALQVRAERLTDLGQPEAVIAGLDRQDHASLPAGASQWIGLAMQQTAIAPPEAILSVGVQLAVDAERRGFAQPAAFTHGALTMSAIASGQLRLAERHAALARNHAATGIGPTAELLVTLAEAALMIVHGDEDAAARHVAEQTPPSTTLWPGRAELWALPLAYVLLPDRRSVLDAADLGPALTTARDAARALVALRSGDIDPASRLPWHQADLLRTHVPSAHLAELAVCVPRHDGAAAVLAQLHDLDHLLHHVVAAGGVAAERASAHLADRPRPEPYRLRVDVLGATGVQITQHDGSTSQVSLARRPKASELLALLSERRRLDRYEVISTIWPEHDDEKKALASLRTTLSVVNDLIEPERTKGTSAFHLAVDGDVIELDQRVTTDADEFEHAIASARSDDEAGLPAQALEGYQTALAWYRGDFVHGLDAAWAELPRLRLRSLATGAMCRVGELVAARGEPETAAGWAERSLRLDPLDERAIRCLVASLDASGDRSTARRTAEAAMARLRDAGVEPGADTTRLLDRIR